MWATRPATRWRMRIGVEAGYERPHSLPPHRRHPRRWSLRCTAPACGVDHPRRPHPACTRSAHHGRARRALPAVGWQLHAAGATRGRRALARCAWRGDGPARGEQQLRRIRALLRPLRTWWRRRPARLPLPAVSCCVPCPHRACLSTPAHGLHVFGQHPWLGAWYDAAGFALPGLSWQSEQSGSVGVLWRTPLAC